MQLVPLDASQARASVQAQELLAAYPFVSEGWPGALAQAQARAWLENLSGQASLLALAGARDWRWLAAWHKLDFDSRLFGRSIGRLDFLAHRGAWPQTTSRKQGVHLLQQAQAQARGEGLECLMARVPVRDLLSAQALERAGFLLYDISLEWVLELKQLPAQTTGPPVLVRPWREEDEKLLSNLAAVSFCRREDYADRFALDPRLHQMCPELYRRWLANSLSGDQADQVLVLERGGKARGFISLKKAPGKGGPQAGCGWVVLNALSPGLRGQGLYHSLLWAGLNWLKEQGARQARVRVKASQQAVIKAWARLGARQALADLTFHHWMEKGGELP